MNEIGSSLGEIKRNLSSASYRIKKLDEITPKINIALSQHNHPTGAVVTSYVNQCLSTITNIEQIIQNIEDSSDSICINLDLIENAENSDQFHAKDYDKDISYIRRSIEYKMEGLQSEFLSHKVAFDNAQTLISTSKSKL